MTTYKPRETINIIYEEEPATKPPPLLTVGPLAWIRENLFGSVLDTILTFVSVAIIYGVIASVISWAIGWGNWFVINLNLRNLIVGLFEPQSEGRLVFLLLAVSFVVGFSLKTWLRISRTVALFLVIALVLMYIVPIISEATIPLPPSYFLAGNVDVVSRASTQTPQNHLGFIARAGEEVTIEVATDVGLSDEGLTAISRFVDKASNALRAEAQNRLDTQTRIAELNQLLAGDMLTANQRDEFNTELERLTVVDPIFETYAVNQHPVSIEILDGQTLEPLAQTTMDSSSPPFTFTVPDDGWYVLHKTIEGDNEGVATLRTTGIYPLMARSGVVEGERSDRYNSIIGDFVTEELRPVVEGKEVPMAVIIDNQYRGERPLSDFLRIYLSPFLTLIQLPSLLILALGTIGYFASGLADQYFSPPDNPRRASNRSAAWMWIALPLLGFVIVNGLGGPLPVTDAGLWGGLLLTIMLTVVGILFSFPIGILLALGRRSDLPVVKGVCTAYIELVRGVPLITVLFMANVMVPLVNPALADVEGAYRAMVAVTLFSAAYLAENVRGGLQSIPPGQEEAGKAVGLAGWQITLYITLPQALRAVIPALVGQFIGLFKDTSLVAIVGLTDMLGMSNTIVNQTAFIGLRREAYLFITIIYFVFSYVMSYVSRRFEETGAGAARRF